MKKPNVSMKIIKEDIGYSATATVGGNFIATQGDNFEELKEMILEAVNLTFEDLNFTYNIDEIAFEYDLPSFFAFYRVINVTALSNRIGMNQSLLSQYINGRKKPSPEQTKRILDGVRQIGRELSEVNLM